MNQAFAFKQKCERSEKTLRSYLKQKETQSTTMTRNNDTVPLINENDVHQFEKQKTKSIEFLPKVFEKTIDNKINEEVNDSSDAIDESEINLPNNCMEVENIQQTIEYTTDEQHMEYIQAEEHIETTTRDYNVEKSTANDVVKDFIAENLLKFICDYCKATFSSRRSLTLHVNCRKCQQLSYECDICKKIFIKKRYLIRHLQRMHRMMNDTEFVNESNDETNSRKYKCHSCPKGEKKNSYPFSNCHELYS